MKCLFFLIIVSSSYIVQAQKHTIGSGEISFTFVSEDVTGKLSGLQTTSKIDLTAIENSVFKGSVKVETIDTGNSVRNWSIKRGKYFNESNYPKITFESSSVEGTPEKFIVTGNLTIKGITKPIAIDFAKNEMKLTGATTLFSSDYDITISKKGKEKNKVDVTFVFNIN